MGCYGDMRQFAQGLAELCSLSCHPKYKTFCPFGTHCHFIHNPKERGPHPRLHQSASLGSASSGPEIDWAALRAAFSPDLDSELARTLGLRLGNGGGGDCCCFQHHQQHQHIQWASGLPMAGRSLSTDSLPVQDNSRSSGSQMLIFEQGQWLHIFSRITVSD